MARIKNPKAKGTAFEHICKKYLEAQGMNVYRSPASLGSADLVTIQKYEIDTDSNNRFVIASLVQLIQCKYLKKYMSKREVTQLVTDAEKLGAEAYLFYREKPRGQIKWDLLFTPKISSKS